MAFGNGRFSFEQKKDKNLFIIFSNFELMFLFSLDRVCWIFLY